MAVSDQRSCLASPDLALGLDYGGTPPRSCTRYVAHYIIRMIVHAKFREFIDAKAQSCRKLALPGGLIFIVAAGPYEVSGCERVVGYGEPTCQNLGDAAQHLAEMFVSSTGTATSSTI